MTPPPPSRGQDHYDYVDAAGLKVDRVLRDFIEGELLPEIGRGSEQDTAQFWAGFEAIIRDFTPRNRELLQRRDELQQIFDDYYRKNPGQPDPEEHEKFLREIGYLEQAPGPEATIRTANLDDEFARVAGPQLVVPILNARFAINAANARWGSLYDALYGTDAIPETPGAEKTASYNPERGAKVIAWGRRFLDDVLPLEGVSHADVERYDVLEGYLCGRIGGECFQLVDKAAYRGFTGDISDPDSIVLRNNGLYLELKINPHSPIGKADKAGVEDIIMESAVSAIMDFEDSIAAVDGADKTLGYRNWLGLCTGELTEEVTKSGKTFTRALADDRTFYSRTGSTTWLHGRSMMLVRNVGHLMTNPAILIDGEEVFEGIMDAVITAACAIPGAREENPRRNSRCGSIYIVKPKQHGPAEVAFTDELFSRVEKLLGLPQFMLKVGVMDEERRTSVNLDACITATPDRVAFINTGFLDRTGDEIHTSMLAGPMARKADLQTAPWKLAYENNNVDAGLERGLYGRAQIGKGMWAKTELMADMLKEKIGQPREGANTVWVPSPTAATLHATHYHRVDVKEIQKKLVDAGRRGSLKGLLTVPVAAHPQWTREEKREELDNNCQSILGYVVRWVEQGWAAPRCPTSTTSTSWRIAPPCVSPRSFCATGSCTAW